ncbi:MAG: M23 family metallopeptidase [Planctomycetota bacterium]|jgi:murein DD-endopeptidase MepM/ murein hydrolase activator NlpD
MPRSFSIVIIAVVLVLVSPLGNRNAGNCAEGLELKASDLMPVAGRVLIYKVTKTGNGVDCKDTIAVTCAGRAPIPEIGVKNVFILRSSLFEAYQEFSGGGLVLHIFTFTKVVNDVVCRSWVREKRLQFPLKVGLEWKGGEIPVIFGVLTRKEVIKCNVYKVVSEEEVEVPAGTYRCLKIEKRIKAKGLPPEFEERYKKAVIHAWYAKGIGLVKRISVDPNSGVTETRVLSGTIEPIGDLPESALSKIDLPEMVFKPGRIHFYKFSGGGYRGWIETSTSSMQTFHGEFGTGVHTVRFSRKKDAWIQSGKHPYSLDGPIVCYRFPMESGKEWEARSGRERLKRRVAGAEIVGTPYRSYVAMKIETLDKSNKTVLEEWIVPKVGVVKQVRHRGGIDETYTLEYLLDKAGSKSPYSLPFSGEAKKCVNAWAIGPSRTSHRGWERYAVDFYGEKGTPVYAARDGTVVEVKQDSRKGGNNDMYIADANYVVIRHSDSTYALYLHLQHNSVPVKVGDRISAGKRIGRIGVTGWTTGPHLHFHVHNGITAIPVAFADIPSNYGIPVKGKTYTPR